MIFFTSSSRSQRADNSAHNRVSGQRAYIKIALAKITNGETHSSTSKHAQQYSDVNRPFFETILYVVCPPISCTSILF